MCFVSSVVDVNTVVAHEPMDWVVLWSAGTHLEFTWHYELGSVDTDQGIHTAEDENGQDDGKITDKLPHLDKEIPGSVLAKPLTVNALVLFTRVNAST